MPAPLPAPAQPAARDSRPFFIWLAAVADDADAASLGDNVRTFALAQLEAASDGSSSSLPPGAAAALALFQAGAATAATHPAWRHPSWPSDGELPLELVVTHASAAAGSAPPFHGDCVGGPLQLELRLEAVLARYAAARGCAPGEVQLLVLGTRQHREKRQHILVAAAPEDTALAGVFQQPLQRVQTYNMQQQREAGEVVVQPDSDGKGFTWSVSASPGW